MGVFEGEQVVSWCSKTGDEKERERERGHNKNKKKIGKYVTGIKFKISRKTIDL